MSERNADTKRNVWQGKNIAFNVCGLLSVVEFGKPKFIYLMQPINDKMLKCRLSSHYCSKPFVSGWAVNKKVNCQIIINNKKQVK